ncbi:NgoMIV family type II restriction endonuclease [Nocardioides sp. NPDC127503]|uniref:NgoMIV family type II restriction endonuclease n=1 Tax=Nocardioides sp. NPDC127503 TaxID=3154516 RepID=UPI00331FB4A8
MSAPDWLQDELGWKPASQKSAPRCKDLFGDAVAPNIADLGSKSSLELAGHIYQSLGITQHTKLALGDGGQKAGASLERAIEGDLGLRLSFADPSRKWEVRRGGLASDYRQFQHLADLQRLFEAQPNLRATVGHDYQVRTDVYVGLPGPEAESAPYLHAAISCKWTIRSDRVQNVRHEFNTLVRSRRGRLPHLALVTAEPLPSRIISIARGTGEVDAVYHLMFDELAAAVATAGSTEQIRDWDEMVSQQRLLPYDRLALDLTFS